MEERRRTKVIPHLWTEGRLVPLVFGVLIRVSDRGSKKCVSQFEQQHMRSLRARLKLDEQEVSMSEPVGYVSTRSSAASAASMSLQKLEDLTKSPFVIAMLGRGSDKISAASANGWAAPIPCAWSSPRPARCGLSRPRPGPPRCPCSAIGPGTGKNPCLVNSTSFGLGVKRYRRREFFPYHGSPTLTLKFHKRLKLLYL